MNVQTTEIVLGLIDDRMRSLRDARALASAQLGEGHRHVGEIAKRIEELDRARREVSNAQARAA